MPSKYTPELKTRAIELVLHAQGDPDTARGAVSRIAEELNISRETLRIWVRTHKESGMSAPTESVDLEAENRRLRKELAESQRANEILKKASAFFAADARATHTSSRRLHRRQPCSLRSRADHPGAVRHTRPHRREHVLRREKPSCLCPVRPRRRGRRCTASTPTTTPATARGNCGPRSTAKEHSATSPAAPWNGSWAVKVSAGSAGG